MSLEKQAFGFVEHQLGDLGGIGIHTHPDLQRLNGFVESAKVETKGGFHKNTGFHLQFTPAFGKAGAADDLALIEETKAVLGIVLDIHGSYRLLLHLNVIGF